MASPDVAVIGGGIAGCAAAAFLAEGGASVRLYEREAIAAVASGRNSGVLQHPMDPVLVPLYRGSLALYAGLDHGFAFPPEPAGTLVVAKDPAALAAARERAAAEFPDLAPEWLEGADLRAAEPALGPGLCAYRLATGRPVPPAAATQAWAARARAAGAELRIGEPAALARRGARVDGVLAGAQLEPAGVVVAAAGPWTAEVVGAAPGWQPIEPVWGVVAQVRLAAPPRHSIEEAGVEALTAPGGALRSIFSIVTAGGTSAVGSTFTRDRPDPEAVAPAVLERATRFVPALAGVAIEGVRACARPLSVDGRPLLGPVPGADGLHVVSGHGPWGVTLGPESARRVAAGVLGSDPEIPPELAAERFGPPWLSRSGQA